MSHQDIHENLNDCFSHLNISMRSSHIGNARETDEFKKNMHGVDSYYAINAPAPGTVGVASARINRSYNKKCDSPSYPSVQKYYANIHDSQVKSLGSSSFLQTPIRSGNALYANFTSAACNYATHGNKGDLPSPLPPPDEAVYINSPPSPVSSSYSELRTAQSRHQPSPHILDDPSRRVLLTDHYYPISQTSSAYDSIYEPVDPMSKVRSYHGPYASPNARGLAPVPSNQPILNPARRGKEAEVDALTNLLVQSMDSTNDPEFFGICSRCGEKVMGEGTGCTAMEQVFHIECFCCVVCLLKLQGKPFYALDSKPYCENCYLSTLEKCCVCTKPILDRILRATGKPYHPMCFTCVVCHKSLDGIPFTVDASNQIHCIEDFHKKFAPRCTVCREPIMPENGQEETVRVVALDRSFHVNCYKCEDCGLVLSSEAEGRGCYPLDNHVLCKSCNAHRVQTLTSKVITEL